MVLLQYVGEPDIRAKGSVTKTLYPFSQDEPERYVDSRDAEHLLLLVPAAFVRVDSADSS
jgi:hypothetical protein